MKTHVLRGSKREIAANLVLIKGDVREAIVFEEEPSPKSPGAGVPDAKDIFAEMRPFMVDALDMDDSREAIYTPIEGE